MVVFAMLSAAIFFIGMFIQQRIWPPKPILPRNQEMIGVLGGSAATVHPQVQKLARWSKPPVTEVEQADTKKEDKIDYLSLLAETEQTTIDAFDRNELIPLGWSGSAHLRALVNTRGAGIQRVVLPYFQAVNRMGLPEKNEDGTKRPLLLLPGVKIKRAASLKEQDRYLPSDLQPGLVSREMEDGLLTLPSYVMYHYENPRDDQPIDTLGVRNWQIVEKAIDPELEMQKVVLETSVDTPQPMKIRKIFTLKRNEYHIGMQIHIESLSKIDKSVSFRYQVMGAHDLPVEGEWYTNNFHGTQTGFVSNSGDSSRAIEDAREIRYSEGSDRLTRTEKLSIQWTGATIQYFASILAVDHEQKNKKFLEFVRSTPNGPAPKTQIFLDDAVSRAITEELKLDQPIDHSYLLYQGPIKVRLLKQLTASGATDPELKDKYIPVEDGLVDRYTGELNLDRLTDAPLPNGFSRFLNSMYWTDIVILFTNLMHSLLYILYSIIPNLGICLIIMTLLVKGTLYPLITRRATRSSQLMAAQQRKIAPEVKKIRERYPNDMMRQREEMVKLYREHNINPASMLGGCLPLLLQMPIMMGLYFALQESVLFRLSPFLWIQNLAAPDMLIWWSEKIPFISLPSEIGSSLYLGPYLNILPIISIALMIYAQKSMMPVSDDPQIQMQQNMMKYMMIFMGFMFYKVAAGLCIYFIIGSIWGMIERKLIPKPKLDEQGNPIIEGPAKSAGKPPKKPGRFRTWLSKKLEEVIKEAEAQREIRRDPMNNSRSPQQNRDQKGKKNRKK